MSCHEPAAALRFAYGRLEYLRPFTSPVKRFCQTALQMLAEKESSTTPAIPTPATSTPAANDTPIDARIGALQKLLHEATKEHRQQIRDVNMGK